MYDFEALIGITLDIENMKCISDVVGDIDRLIINDHKNKYLSQKRKRLNLLSMITRTIHPLFLA